MWRGEEEQQQEEGEERERERERSPQFIQIGPSGVSGSSNEVQFRGRTSISFLEWKIHYADPAERKVDDTWTCIGVI